MFDILIITLMEKVTFTKLYEVLAQKVGRNEAECLTQYIYLKVKYELNNKTEILATRVFVKEEFQKLREEIHGFRNESKGEIHGLRGELKGDIHGLRDELKGEIHGLRNEVRAEIHGFRNEVRTEIHGLRNELKGDFHGLRDEFKGDIHGLRTEMKEHSLSQQKWMLAIFITIVTLFFGLLLKR